jgi:hypothetical protein
MPPDEQERLGVGAASACCSEGIVTATVITTTPNIASAETMAITANDLLFIENPEEYTLF